MDFVVVGLGLGALTMLLGIALTAWAAPRLARLAGAAPVADARRLRALSSQRRGMGQALLSAGAAILLATVGGLAGALDDRTGALMIATTATVAAFGLLVWAYLDHLRHPVPPPARDRSRAAHAANPPGRPTRTEATRADAFGTNGHLATEPATLAGDAAPPDDAAPAPVVLVPAPLLAIAANAESSPASTGSPAADAATEAPAPEQDAEAPAPAGEQLIASSSAPARARRGDGA